MNRYEIRKAQVTADDVHNVMWAVILGQTVIHVAVTEQAATDWLRSYREEITQSCQHLNMTAEAEVVNGALTLTCDRCGMVGEFDLDVMFDLTWVGQQ